MYCIMQVGRLGSIADALAYKYGEVSNDENIKRTCNR